jgi:hypothetical protein
MSNTALGYAGAVVAVFFYGTCYVPAKKYPTYGKYTFEVDTVDRLPLILLLLFVFPIRWNHFSMVYGT